MSEYKNEKIREFLEQLESISEPLSEFEISERIRNFAKEKFGKNPPDILIWEQIAFDFIENYPKERSAWNTYFGPKSVLPDKEGKMVEYPSIQELTPETISYWEQRAKEVGNPILKARYSNLVWDFSERVKGERPHYSIAQIFIDSVVEIAGKNLHKPVDVIKKLERALFLALAINDSERINKLINTIINYEEKVAEDNKPGLWGFSYELLVKNKKIKLSKNKEFEIVSDLENRFERLLKGNNQWAAERAADLLVDYYSRLGEKEKVKDILLKLGKMIQSQAEGASPLVACAWLEELYHLYLQHGMKNEAHNILSKIWELSKQAKSELKKIEISVEIPKKEVEKYINRLIDGDLNTALMRIAVNYIPKKDKVVKQIQSVSKKAPIPFLFSRRIMDNGGRVISTVGSLEEDIDGHIILQISQNMQINSPFLRKTLDALISKFNLSTSEIVKYLYESPIFDEGRKEFFVRGIDAFLKGDFLVSLHLLIPQLEALVRNLAEKIGIPILKPSRSGGFFYRTLDELLREEGIIKVLGEDMCLYLRALLTDPRGWNLRNDITHGIIKPEMFNQITADRTFHALLCLALVREKNAKEK